ncbi:hypothetical protein HZ326_16347 [Fusarium oxysporum f. sp. albedinis]|nr:hypothetical protein HZ326_16347 [Fusarium oxysporum f. sp. albedinis]
MNRRKFTAGRPVGTSSPVANSRGVFPTIRHISGNQASECMASDFGFLVDRGSSIRIDNPINLSPVLSKVQFKILRSSINGRPRT